jgi:O-antigen/teichoic acid export membrane protein
MGVLSLIWVVVGYFSFLDMGLGRAVTVSVAQAQVGLMNRREDQLSIVGTAATCLFALGASAMVLIGCSIGIWGVPLRLSSPGMEQEVLVALLWMLPSLPLLLLSSAFRGHLEGLSSFRALNLLRIPVGLMLAGGPCLTSLFGADLAWASISILVVRLAHVLALFWLLSATLELKMGELLFSLMRGTRLSVLKRLLAFGGWVTVSNIVGPIIVYLDRYLIGALVAAASVAYYAVPFDLASRLPILVASLCTVLLPEFAKLGFSHLQGSQELRSMVSRYSLISALVVVLLVFVAWVITPYALDVWVGSAYVVHSTEITRILLLAFGVNALAQLPFTALQASGQVRSLALLHMSEIVPYAIAVYWAIALWGVVGAAWVCFARSLLDYLAIIFMWQIHSGTARPKANPI